VSETHFGQMVAAKTPADRTVMHVLYGLHTVAWASAGGLAVIALIANYVRRGDELDAIYLSHHDYMIRTFWWTVLWLVLASPLWLLVLPGIGAYCAVGLWYLYRCIRGWLHFTENQLP
jgi:uncharacterized membrane protein